VLFSGDSIPLSGDMPIYEDVLDSAKSIQKLKSISGIRVLLSSWDDPQEGGLSYNTMDGSLRYIQRIHEAVIKNHYKDPTPNSMDLCRSTLRELGLPDTMANPLVVRSFQANLKAADHLDLLKS
jgi:hypothetical protein